jgi:hypothetical protein
MPKPKIVQATGIRYIMRGFLIANLSFLIEDASRTNYHPLRFCCLSTLRIPQTSRFSLTGLSTFQRGALPLGILAVRHCTRLAFGEREGIHSGLAAAEKPLVGSMGGARE